MNHRYAQFLARYPLLHLVGNTPLLKIDVLQNEYPQFKIYAKAEWMNPGGSIKDRPVMRMILEAILSGELTAERTILDSSSGNAGIAYAMLGKLLGFDVELVVPGNASQERRRRILAHGARLTLTDPVLGYDEALRACHRLAESNRGKYLLLNQYANENNWRSHYETTATEILRQMEGKITHFVAGVGTGGTITGVGRRLKEVDPTIRVICILPESFPGIEGLKPLERPEDIRPEILDESVIDENVPVTAEEAYHYCHLLASHGIFVGQSSGAYLAGVHAIAKRDKIGSCVTVFSDTGERYHSTRLWD